MTKTSLNKLKKSELIEIIEKSKKENNTLKDLILYAKKEVIALMNIGVNKNE